MGNQTGALSNRFILIGGGKGPKNVLFERPDGTRVVTVYALWKHKYKGEKIVAEAKYVHATGFVQFKPFDREVNGQDVLDITIKTPGGDGKLVRITLWPEFLNQLDFTPEIGDFVAVDGKFDLNTFKNKDGESVTQAQINPIYLSIAKGIKKPERKVVTADASSAF